MVMDVAGLKAAGLLETRDGECEVGCFGSLAAAGIILVGAETQLAVL